MGDDLVNGNAEGGWGSYTGEGPGLKLRKRCCFHQFREGSHCNVPILGSSKETTLILSEPLASPFLCIEEH